MANNILTNTAISERYILRKQIEKLQPIGKMYMDTYERVKIDKKTTILRKPQQ